MAIPFKKGDRVRLTEHYFKVVGGSTPFQPEGIYDVENIDGCSVLIADPIEKDEQGNRRIRKINYIYIQRVDADVVCATKLTPPRESPPLPDNSSYSRPREMAD